MTINLDCQLDWVWCQIRDTPLVGFMRVSPGRLNQGRRPSPKLVVPSPEVAPTQRCPRESSGNLCPLLLSFMPDPGSFSLLTQTKGQHLSGDPPSLQTRLGQQRCPTSWTNSPVKRTPGSPPRLCPASEAAAKTFSPT